ncbi:MAG: hypothetical protein GX675_03375 [Erysipelotrichaceae bacterium]|nr:hypothetical protein [Erysipelotrichaceae bacterium]
MFKKIAISIMGLLLLNSIVLTGYKIFEPNNKIENDLTLSNFYINYNNVEEYTLSGGNNTSHYFLFCVPYDTNCKYIYESIFPSITSKNNGIPINTIIEYVDLTELLSLDTFDENLKKWEIKTYPALISCKVDNNTIIIINTLEFDENDPLNSDDIINWMVLNDIYSGSHQLILPN